MNNAIKNFVLLTLLLCSCDIGGGQYATASDGVKISFDKRGSAETAIIFIHGWSNNKTIWKSQMTHFLEEYMVVSVDLPGFGESGNNRNDWSLSNFGHDIVSVIKKLDLKQVVLVGFSMGGPIAIEAASFLPQKIVGVVLVDALENVEANFPPAVVSFMDSLFMDLVSNPTPEKLLAGGFYKKNPDQSFQRVLAFLTDGPRTGWRESLQAVLRWQNEDCINELQKIRVPIKGIYSSRGPVDIESFQKYIPTFEANIIADTGHLVMWDATEEFNVQLENYMRTMTDK